ncbi:MAG: ABC transporter permease [Silvanigrellaceae bacterium]|nr:ABC transporter permease [Silvanigrellaceae bacterium]
MDFFVLILSILSSTIRMATPLAFAALGGLNSERCGIINIALEGNILVGAFAAASVTVLTDSIWLGFFCGGIAGFLLSLLQGIFVILLNTNQIITGIAINIFAAGFVPFLSNIIFHTTNSTPEISLEQRFIYMPMILVLVVTFLMIVCFKFTPFGLWSKFAGEHPEALEAAGIDLTKVRWTGLLASGFLAGLGGATLSTCLTSFYTRNMSAGRGFMALAALIVGNWKPMGVIFACMLFGFFDAIAIALQSFKLNSFEIPIQFIQVIPYLLTIFVVVGLVGKSNAPKYLGTSIK